jgi:putative transferase (TIGR04331 family)
LGERFLITTADERSWKTERPLVFLGEWCRRVDREHVWANLDSVVARPVCFDGADRERVIAYIDVLSRELLAELAQLLNRLHGVRGSLRLWRILLGHWIERYTSLLFHRWHAVEQLLADHRISGTIVFRRPAECLAGSDTTALVWASNDDLWNNLLIGRVLQEFSAGLIEYRELDDRDDASHRTAPGTRNGLDRPTAYLTNIIDWILGILQRETSSFVISSYLPRLQAIHLSLRLGDVPTLRRSPPVQPVAVNAALRAANRLNPGAHTGFPAFARHMILEMLPTCYFEGFNALHQQLDQLDWPSRPRLIFTSNSFDTGEVFKLWAAQKAESGCPYIVGQHGSNYGTASYCPSETECVETADAFITWGWRGTNEKYRPAFIFKTCGVSRNWDRYGRLLLIETCLPHLMSAWDPYPEFAAYQHDQFSFVEGLPEEIRRLLTVRLHHQHIKMSWNEAERWRRSQPGVTLDNGTAALATLMRRSRLVVHSYDSTGILETLALNIPTLCFWTGGMSHLRASAVPFYELLVDAGILHVTAQSAARKVAEVWSDLRSWWAGAAVQDARRRFCHEYARTIDTPIATLARLLREVRSRNQPDVTACDALR